MSGRDVAFAVQSNRGGLGGIDTRKGNREVVRKNRSGTARVTGMLDAPEFLTGLEVVGVCPSRGRTDDLETVVMLDHGRGGVRLAHVAAGPRATFLVQVVKIARPKSHPAGVTGAGVQRGHVLNVGTVEGQDQ